MNQKLLLTLAVFAGFAGGILSQYVAPALIVRATPPWREFSAQVGKWRVVEESAIDSESLAALHPDDYIKRTYSAPESADQVGVFIAYFKTQRPGAAPNSPKALPNGWQAVNSDVIELPVSGQAIPMNVSLLEKQNTQVMVLYWYQQGKDTFAAEPTTNGISYLLPRGRADIAMVRVVVPVRQSVASARAVGEDFARNAYPLVLAHTRRTL